MGLLSVIGLGEPSSESALADPKHTHRAGPEFGWSLLSDRLFLVHTVQSTSYKTFDIKVNCYIDLDAIFNF